MPTRRQKGEGGVYRRADGRWCGSVELGWSAKGTRKRAVVTSLSKAEALRKFRAKKAEVAAHGGAGDRQLSTGRWLAAWLEDIAAPRVKPRTIGSYRSIVNRHLIPRIGKRPLASLEQRHVRELYRALERDGLSSSYVLKVHRVLKKALTDAIREDLLTRNVCDRVDAPLARPNQRPALTADQARHLLASCATPAEAARWGSALLLGARQGECLGLEWPRMTRGRVDLSWQLQRLTWRHGCRRPCGARPARCPARALDVPGSFEHRPQHATLTLTRPKSRAGQRVIPLPAQMEALFALAHADAGNPTTGLVFTRQDGTPVDPRTDSLAWHAMLARCGLPDVPLHSARHTTATLLLELGVDPEVIRQIMGHSTVLTTQGYQHVSQPLELKAMEALGALILGPVSTARHAPAVTP